MTHKFDKNVLDLGKRKEFYPYGFMAHDEKFKEEMPTKKNAFGSLTDRKIPDKEYDHALNVSNKFEIKAMKDYHKLYLKCEVLLFLNWKI